MQNAKFMRFFSVLLILFLLGCQRKIEQGKKEIVIPVRVQKILLKNLSKTLEYVGNVKAQDEAIVYPKVTGKVIEKIRGESSKVNKNDPLIYLDRDEVGLKFQKAPVESPIQGVVGRIFVDIGQNVDTKTPVALVVNMDKVKINLEIPERYLPKIILGQGAKIKVDAYPEEQFSGEVTKIIPVIDLQTRSAPIEITINNPEHRLKSGMFAKVVLVIEEHKNVPVILKEATLGKDPEHYVYVIVNNRAVLRKITLGIREGSDYEVVAGLKEGDLVVIMGQQKLYENAVVSLEENK